MNLASRLAVAQGRHSAPEDPAVPLSTNTGAPLLEAGSRDAVARGLQTLLGRLLPDAGPRRSGLFGRLRDGVAALGGGEAGGEVHDAARCLAR